MRRPPSICQVKVSFLGVAPPIWRRLQVYSATNLGKLVYALLEVFDWEGDSDARFFAAGVEVDDAEARCLGDVVSEGASLVCAYGDWQLELSIERVFEALSSVRYPTCYEGERAAPPEQCGGPGGYARLVADAAAGFEPEVCDLDAADRRLGSSDRS